MTSFDPTIPLSQYQPEKHLLNSRIILVTGADTDLGETVATSCAAHGATVILLGASRRKLESLYDKIEQSGAPQPALIPVNLTKANEDSYVQLTETLTNEFDRLDGLVHCDIDIGVLSPLNLYDLPTFSRVLAANGGGLATVALRPHLVWGPGDNHLIPRLLGRARAGRVRLIGRRDKLVDATYIDNAAEAHLQAADRLGPEAACAGRAPVPLPEGNRRGSPVEKQTRAPRHDAPPVRDGGALEYIPTCPVRPATHPSCFQSRIPHSVFRIVPQGVRSRGCEHIWKNSDMRRSA